MMGKLTHPPTFKGYSWLRLCAEKYRLATFASYPANAPKYPILLAESGFLYCGDEFDDTVVCYFCGAVKRNWRADKDISEAHMPDCTMVSDNKKGNIPLQPTSNPRSPECHEDSSYPRSGTTRPAVSGRPPGPQPSVSSRPSLNNMQHYSKVQDCAIIVDEPKRPDYAHITKRRETFADWPPDHPVKKEVLAEAGFYLDENTTRCFYCGGGLKDWEAEEDAWVTHPYWFPKCGFMRMKLGEVFIQIVQEFRKNKEEPTTITFTMVTDKMRVDPAVFHITSKGNPLKFHSAVQAVMSVGFNEEHVLRVAESLTKSGISAGHLSADKLLSALPSTSPCLPPNIDISPTGSDARHRRQRDLSVVKQENDRLRQLTACKTCLAKESEVVFLPCRHFVCCTECANEIRECPCAKKTFRDVCELIL